MITPQSIPAPSVPELAPARANFAGYGEGWSLSDSLSKMRVCRNC